MRAIPESANRRDWPRLVAGEVNRLAVKVKDAIADIATNASNIAANQTSISTNVTNINAHSTRITALENKVDYTVSTVTFAPISEPSSPATGETYFDSTSNKLRTYDGTTWQDHW